VEPNPFKSIFNVNALQDVLNNLDLTDVVQRTMALADDESPAYAWLDAAGEIQLAESAREIDGLVLFQVKEYNPESCEVNFKIATWIHEIGLVDFESLLRSALEAES
jgi:hypothetical protein